MRRKNVAFRAYLTFFELIFVGELKFAECSTSHNAIGYGKNLIASGRNLDTCQVAGRPGDCNPEVCGGIGRFVCESRYTRFWDGKEKVDRTQKSCKCVQESICGLFGVPYFGCRSYSALSSSAQIIIRKWTLSRKERQSRYQSRLKIMPLSPANRFKGERYNVSNSSRRVWSNSAPIYSDKDRHNQLLLMANTRFCCRTSNKSLPLAQAVTTSGTHLKLKSLNVFLFLIILLNFI